MNLPVPRIVVLPLFLSYCCAAAAAKPGVVVELSDVRLDLVSTIDGSSLPITRLETWNGATWRLGAELRSGERINGRYAYQPNADVVHDLPTRIGASLDNSAATASIAQLFGDVSAATALGPFPEAHSASAYAGWEARFHLPAYSALTMSGHVTIGTEGDPDNGYANFSSGFYSSIYLLPDVVFALERVDQADQDFTITAVNPYGDPLEWFQYMATDVSSVALASPIPEPAAPAMLAAGLLAGWRICRRTSVGGPHAHPAQASISAVARMPARRHGRSGHRHHALDRHQHR